jgi:hypothetical protein
MDRMKQISAAILALAVILTNLSSLQAQSKSTDHVYKLDDPSTRVPATIDQMAWLAGSWVGEGLGGTVEETWNDPSGGTMVGLFKLVHGEEPSIYEIELIAEEEGTLVWKVKHFNPDFSAWEEKTDFTSFRLVKIEERAAYFDGLTIELDDDDKLRVFLNIGHDGKVREEALSFERAR